MGEMLIVLVVALLVFGPNKLPQLGDALGKGIRNFKKAANHDESDETGPEKAAQAQVTAGSLGVGQHSVPTSAATEAKQA